MHCGETSGATRENTCLALPDIGRRVVGSKRERRERKRERERERRARERERDPLGPEKSRPLGLYYIKHETVNQNLYMHVYIHISIYMHIYILKMQATRILLLVFAFRRHNNLHDPVTNSL